MNRSVLVIMAILLGCIQAVDNSAVEGQQCSPFTEGRRVGDLENPELVEASGMASSRLQAELTWVINDGGNGAFVYAVGPDGSDRGRFLLRNAPNTDWEDLASFRLKGRAYLLVADFGDNKSVRESCYLYIVPEPAFQGQRVPPGLEIDWAWRIQYIYEHGPRDSESVAVDTDEDRILILTKRISPPQIYELMLTPPDAQEVRVARQVGALTTIPAPPQNYIRANPIFGRLGSQPTAMDLSTGDRLLAVLCYKNAYLFRLDPQTDLKTVFAQTPQTIELPDFAQAEALCFGPRGKTLFVTSEKRPAPLWRLDRNPQCP